MENENKPKKLTVVHLQQLNAVNQEVRRKVAAAGSNLEHLPKEVREKLFSDGLWWAYRSFR